MVTAIGPPRPVLALFEGLLEGPDPSLKFAALDGLAYLSEDAARGRSVLPAEVTVVGATVLPAELGDDVADMGSLARQEAEPRKRCEIGP